MAKQPKAAVQDSAGIETDAPLPISHPIVSPLPDIEPLPVVVTCCDCAHWKQMNARASIGECMMNSRYSHGPVITTDMVTCSLVKPR